jgi:L-glutamine-phosphate cytidylyltransferase
VSKAIIVAAGRGRRLGPETDDIPKCMVSVGGRPILHWQLRALAAAGISEVVLVRGYLGDRIAGPEGGLPLRFVENAEWASNNILASLLYASAEMDSGFFFSYADIVYAPLVAEALARAAALPDAADVSLIVDRRWEDAYVGRTEHPLPEAELASVLATSAGPAVARVGKQAVPREQAAGEFIGLAHFTAAGAAALRAEWQRALAVGGLEAPYGRAPSLRQAYLTDALNALADGGRRLAPVFIDGQWREIDTRQDLASAERSTALWG